MDLRIGLGDPGDLRRGRAVCTGRQRGQGELILQSVDRWQIRLTVDLDPP